MCRRTKRCALWYCVGYLSRVVATLAAMRHRGLSACSARGFW